MTDEGIPKDHVEGDFRDTGDGGLEARLKSGSTWLRLLFMLLTMILFGLANMVGCVVVVLQFFWVLFTGETKKELTRVGHQLALYAGEIIDFLTYNTEERPFPFDRDWPSSR